MYFIPHGDTLGDMFKNSRILSKYSVGILLKRQFGMKEDDVALWAADKSGISARPTPGYETIAPEKRLWYIIHRDLQTHLSGQAVNVMASKYAEILGVSLALVPGIRRDEWSTMPDLYRFLRGEVFNAAVQALCGTGLLEVCPTFVQDFWAYDDSFATIFRRIPRLFAPGAYAARERMHENIKRWHAWTASKFEWETAEEIDADWEPVYGSRVMRSRAAMLKKSGMSPDGWAALDYGFIWT